MINYLSSMFLGKNLETGNKLITNSGYFSHKNILLILYCIFASFQVKSKTRLKNFENLELN